MSAEVQKRQPEYLYVPDIEDFPVYGAGATACSSLPVSRASRFINKKAPTGAGPGAAGKKLLVQHGNGIGNGFFVSFHTVFVYLELALFSVG